ncbi:MAG: hypothetical protein ACTTKH_04735 [Treponema sp.]
MSLSDITYKFRDFWSDFKKDKAGLVGIVILSLLCSPIKKQIHIGEV